jgi:tetratricopeptide (TPR) repeat protein
MFFRGLFVLPVLIFPVFSVFSQLNSVAGAALSSAVAERFLGEALRLIEEDRWGEALTVLERGDDFADVSSDISYLLALVRRHEGFPLPAVREALRRAFETGCWVSSPPAQAYLLEAEILIWLRDYAGALRVLDAAEGGVPEFWSFSGPDAGKDGGEFPPRREDQSRLMMLRLLALKGLPDRSEFLRHLMLALDRYPRDPRPVEMLFLWAAGREAGNSGSPERTLIDLALRRLPFLLDSSPRLAYLAAPFIRDTEEARRLVSAYRALGKAERESLPISVELGLIDDGQAVEEFFKAPLETGLEKSLIQRVWSLLRSREGRELFCQRLLAYSGLIYSDSNGDGRIEERVHYSAGIPREYYGDADQDGIPELRVFFSAGGVPLWAEQALGEGPGITVEWESYPAVLRAELGELIFDPAPGNFFFAPLRLILLTAGVLSGETAPAGELGLPYPEADAGQARLNPRTLVSHALNIRRPSREFPGAFEHIELEQGIPRRAVEILEGKVVALTEFSRGLPRTQRLDLDLDGRMETVRHFREVPVDEAEPLAYEKFLELVETDRDQDGLYEIGEFFLPDGTVIYSWDTDGDGVRDYVEIRNND